MVRGIRRHARRRLRRSQRGDYAWSEHVDRNDRDGIGDDFFLVEGVERRILRRNPSHDRRRPERFHNRYRKRLDEKDLPGFRRRLSRSSVDLLQERIERQWLRLRLGRRSCLDAMRILHNFVRQRGREPGVVDHGGLRRGRDRAGGADEGRLHVRGLVSGVPDDDAARRRGSHGDMDAAKLCDHV